jgi:hypothetical protein
MTDLNALKIGDTVSIMAKGKRVDCAISNVRYIRRGKNAGKREYTLAPFQKRGKTYAWTVRGEALLGQPKGTYTQEQINEAIGAEQGTRQDIQDRKDKRAERGREAIGDLDHNGSCWWRNAVSGTKISIGDEILVNYRDGSKWETVAKVNFKTGKVGIEKHRNDDLEMLMDMAAAIRGKNRRSSNIRWIHPDHILKVKQPERKLPCSISDNALETLCDKGWAQMRFSNGEFIVNSYVVAFEKDNARKGSTYETVDSTIYFDPDLKVYWRNTGCFD